MNKSNIKKFKKIYIEITNKCNLNCKFCSKDNRISKEMSLDDFEYILKEIDNYTDYIYLHVKGEPLLHTFFKDILILCKKYNKQVNITTNGTLLKYQLNNIIKSNIVRQINVSMQSLINKNYLLDILNSTKELLNKTKIQVVYRIWAVENNELTGLEKDIISEILKYFNLNKNILEEIEQVNNIKLLDRFYLNKNNLFTWPNLNNEFISEIGTCYGLRRHIAILADGTVIPCCLDSNGVINLGNIFKEHLDDILTKKRAKDIIANFENNKLCEELCQKCDYITRFKKSN